MLTRVARLARRPSWDDALGLVATRVSRAVLSALDTSSKLAGELMGRLKREDRFPLACTQQVLSVPANQASAPSSLLVATRHGDIEWLYIHSPTGRLARSQAVCTVTPLIGICEAPALQL